MSNVVKREAWVWEDASGAPQQSSVHRHQLPGIIQEGEGAVRRYVPEPPTSEQVAKETLREVLELLLCLQQDDWSFSSDHRKIAERCIFDMRTVLRLHPKEGLHEAAD